MNKPFYLHRLTNKEKFDLRVMQYFFPKSGGSIRVQHNDRIKMALLSSRGIQPKRRTKGFNKLLLGKTYRDLQITHWKNDIKDGYMTKSEVYESLPVWLSEWAQEKLRYVPYDTEGKSSKFWISMYYEA